MDNIRIVQLIDDAKIVGYKRNENNPYLFDAIYKSEIMDFQGTEQDFLKANLGYKYIELSDWERLCTYTNKKEAMKNEHLYLERLKAKKVL